MTYIAEITSTNRLSKRAIALLLGKKRPDGMWIGVPKEEVTIHGNHALNECQLILLELDNNKNPTVITTASDRLVECLRDWSLRLTRFDSKNAEIELSKQSLEYQSLKLYQKDVELKRRDELQRQQEQKLLILQRLAQDKTDAAERQHEALKAAWEHLYYKEQQLRLKDNE
ncbi:MAG: hypothetical protein ACRCZS_06685 [Chroococcidiopsis sp.]